MLTHEDSMVVFQGNATEQISRISADSFIVHEKERSQADSITTVYIKFL